MSFLGLYALFALTTALTGIYELLLPVLREKELESGLYPHKAIYIVTSLILFTLAAPLIVLSCIIPSWGEAFRNSFLKALFEQEKI